MLAGRYKPDGPKLSGGQGSVQVCRDIWLDREVVVKRLHTGTDAASLKKEVSARQKIASKYLAQIYDYFLDTDGEPSLVSEYISGPELSSNAVIPITDEKFLFKLLYQLGRGIEDFHASGIVHRDIKPHNCRFDSEGMLRIFDLGISTDLSETGITKIGAGTPGFLAPELYSAGDKAVTPAIDVYAWGATAWFLTTVGLPKALLSIPPQAKQLAPSFSKQCSIPAISEVVDRSLSVDAQNRPTMGQIVERLRAELTVGLHRGLLIGPDGRQFAVGADHAAISVGNKAKGHSITIRYDGYRFRIEKCAGDVYVNNHAAVAGAVFPGACVVTFGAPEEGSNRMFLNFSSAHPEVVL